MISALDLTDRAYAMDATDLMCIVGTADRQIHIYDLKDPFKKFKQVESPLKWQTRVISCFSPSTDNNDLGYAIGSIEGRVGIQYTQRPDQDRKNFSFKCHRVDIPSGSMPGTPAVYKSGTTQSSAQISQNVFAINDITFHKEHGTFCTAGGDGSIVFWDAAARTKLKGEFDRWSV